MDSAKLRNIPHRTLVRTGHHFCVDFQCRANFSGSRFAWLPCLVTLGFHLLAPRSDCLVGQLDINCAIGDVDIDDIAILY